MNALHDFAHTLHGRIDGDVRTDPMSRLLYSTDASLYQVMPLAVVIPRTTGDIVGVMEAAAHYGLPVLPRGGGTALAGQTVNECVVIDMSRHIDAILEINTEESWARVQPGVILDILNRQAGKLGLLYGPDPASSSRATMGGVIANNATGSHSIVYGMTVEHVLEVTAVLSDGSTATFGPTDKKTWNAKAKGNSLEAKIYRGVGVIVDQHADLIRNGYPKVWRRTNGYNLDRLVNGWPRNLASLIVGSEGTLAVVTEAKVRLCQKPKHTALAIYHFEDLVAGLSVVPRLLEEDVSAVELIDDYLVELARQSPFKHLVYWVEGNPQALLVVEVSGDTEAEVKAKLDRIASLDVGQSALVRADTPKAIADVWAVRKAGLGILMSRPGDHKPMDFIDDAAVPVEHLASYVRDLRDMLTSYGKQASYYAHASAGELHIRPILNMKDPRDVEIMAKIAQGSFDLVKKLGGATSGEHGDGIARAAFNRALFGEELYDKLVQVKQVFDPDNRLNPNRLVSAPPVNENLRYGPSYRTREPAHELYFDWSAWGGYAGAVEMCNGSAECRNLGEGVMCPSFRATREESDTTRGRANALRAALSGRWPGGLTDEGIKKVLDLCLECKACKAECPSAVDMARMKSEWLAQYYKDHGTPLRSLLFGNYGVLSRFAQPFAPVVNPLLNHPLVRKPMEKALGITTRHTMPAFTFTPQSFKWWYQRRAASQAPDGKPEVVLFPDCYVIANYPEIGKAAVRVLEALGYHVRLGPDICCGRTMISKGLLSRARWQGERVVAGLANATDGFRIPVVGLEPSCLLTFRDEYLALLDDRRKRDLAEVSFTIEEFVANQAKGGALPVDLKPNLGRVHLHGHCYQKALVGTGPSVKALSLFGYDVSLIDAGCCGMAGSFGYEAEHYEISREVAEERLLPAIRATAPEDLIAAAGTSCRTQIGDLSGRKALHPVELMAAALAE